MSVFRRPPTWFARCKTRTREQNDVSFYVSRVGTRKKLTGGDATGTRRDRDRCRAAPDWIYIAFAARDRARGLILITTYDVKRLSGRLFIGCIGRSPTTFYGLTLLNIHDAIVRGVDPDVSPATNCTGAVARKLIVVCDKIAGRNILRSGSSARGVTRTAMDAR